jgi:hypothetical protein
MEEFANDRVITFLLNSFPKEEKTGERIVEKYNENNIPQLDVKDKTFLQTINEFFRKYWFILFILLLILSFVLWKRFLKN